MSATQKVAWYVLAINGLTLLTVVSLIPFLGHGALGGTGILGFLGFQPLFLRKKRGKVVADERDQFIWHRAQLLAYSIFWVLFVFAAVFGVAVVYGWHGTVPVFVIQYSVMGALMVVTTSWALAVLVQYARGTGHVS